MSNSPGDQYSFCLLLGLYRVSSQEQSWRCVFPHGLTVYSGPWHWPRIFHQAPCLWEMVLLSMAHGHCLEGSCFHRLVVRKGLLTRQGVQVTAACHPGAENPSVHWEIHSGHQGAQLQIPQLPGPPEGRTCLSWPQDQHCCIRASDFCAHHTITSLAEPEPGHRNSF